MPWCGFSEGRTLVQHVGDKSAEVNVSDHKYEVEHNKRNRPEIPRGGGGTPPPPKIKMHIN